VNTPPNRVNFNGAIAVLCRVGDPGRKGKVESAIGDTQRTPLKEQPSRAGRRRLRF